MIKICMVGKDLSIIIPIYNAESFVKKCIQSVINSCVNLNYEILLIDDGSTDDSGCICDQLEIEHEEINVIHKKNGGVSSARNIGIEIAQGKYICFCDSDDYIDTGIVKDLDIIKNNYVDLVVTNIDLLSKRSMEKKTSEKIYEHLPKEFFANGKIHSVCGKIYKKDIILKHNIKFPNISLSEDTLFNIKYLMYCEKIAVTESNYYYYVCEANDNSLTKKINENAFEIYSRVEEALYCYLKEKEYPQFECIKNSTMFPQYYGSILKVLKNKKISFKRKKEILDKYLIHKNIKPLFNSVQHESLGEKIFCFLILRKMYFLICIIQKIKNRK